MRLGDVTSLINYKSLTDYCFYCLFASSDGLYSPPELPSMELKPWCYAWMFSSCTRLKYPPKLPSVMTLPANCYDSMFYNCQALNSSKITLPAISWSSSSYAGMFKKSHVSEVNMYCNSKQSGSMNEMFYEAEISRLRYNLGDSESYSDWLTTSSCPLFILNGPHENITRGYSSIPISSPVITQWWIDFGKDNYNMGKVYDGVVLYKKTLTSSYYLIPSNNYVWHVNVTTGSFTLNAISEPNIWICYADLIIDLAADTSVVQGTNVSIVDAITPEKRNLCKIKWIEGTAYIFVEKVIDLPV